MGHDYSLAPGTGPYALELVAHRPDCKIVRAQAARGEPVGTLIDCARPLPPDVLRCDCLNEPDDG